MPGVEVERMKGLVYESASVATTKHVRQLAQKEKRSNGFRSKTDT